MKNYTQVSWVILCFCFTSCLKTRAQLREEGGAFDQGSRSIASAKGTQMPESIDVELGSNELISDLKLELRALENRISTLEKEGDEALPLVTPSGLPSPNPSQSPTESLPKNLPGGKFAKWKENFELQLQSLNSSLDSYAKTQHIVGDNIEQLNLRVQALEEFVKTQSNFQNEASEDLKALSSQEILKRAKVALKKKQANQSLSLCNHLLSRKNSNAIQQEGLILRSQSFSLKKEYKKAILDDSALLDAFPKSKWAPQALLQSSESFFALGMKEEAKSFLEDLLDRFPKSNEAKKAKLKLR